MVSRWTIPSSRRDLIPKYVPVYQDLRLSRCESCRRVFTNKDDLRHHISLSHTGRKPHACVICGKRYGQIHQLNSHFKLHREPRLQEFAILKLHHQAVSEPTSPLNTTVGSFKVPKALKSYVSEPTFKSFGTLQSFTITQLNKPEPDEINDTKVSVKLPKTDVNNYVTNHIRGSGDAVESGKRKRRKAGIATPAVSGKQTHPDITNQNNNLARDSGTQTSRTRVTSQKDYWIDTKSEWQAHRSRKESQSNGTVAASTGYSKSVISEPISFKASTPKEPRFFDDPDSVSRGMSGIGSPSGFDPMTCPGRRRFKRNRLGSRNKMSDTLSSVTHSIYE